MNYDVYGQAYCDTAELCDLLYQNPDLDISKFRVSDPATYNASVAELFADLPSLVKYTPVDNEPYDLDTFDLSKQGQWMMPESYQQLDIAQVILDLCSTQAELQRVGQELLLYQERNMFDLLRYMKYMVDTFRKNNIVWGVGRGSSVASYVLYLLGVHRINSMFYELDIHEFLR